MFQCNSFLPLLNDVKFYTLETSYQIQTIKFLKARFFRSSTFLLQNIDKPSNEQKIVSIHITPMKLANVEANVQTEFQFVLLKQRKKNKNLITTFAYPKNEHGISYFSNENRNQLIEMEFIFYLTTMNH